MHVQSFLPTLGLTLFTISATRAHVVAKRDLTVSSSIPAAWSYGGCWTDTPQARGLSGASYADDSMTEDSCIAFCDQKGYAFAGVEYGKECYCGYEILSTSSQTAESDCSFPCAGDSSELCGAGNRMNVFTNGNKPPAESPGADGYSSVGCYTDSQSARTLSTYMPTSDGIVFVKGCVDTCSSKGFSYAGVEYGQECYCGNEILAPAAPAASGCNMPCTGDKTELCGGPDRINLYYNGN